MEINLSLLVDTVFLYLIWVIQLVIYPSFKYISDQNFSKCHYPGDVIKKAKQIELLAFDVDGVLTDGGLYYDHEGNELKKFFAQDGHGIKIVQSIGIEIMIISGREAACVDHRAQELGIEYVVQGSRDKLKSFYDQNISISLEKVFDKSIELLN